MGRKKRRTDIGKVSRNARRVRRRREERRVTENKQPNVTITAYSQLVRQQKTAINKLQFRAKRRKNVRRYYSRKGCDYHPCIEHNYFRKVIRNDFLFQAVSETEAAPTTNVYPYHTECEVMDVRADDIPDPIDCTPEGTNYNNCCTTEGQDPLAENAICLVPQPLSGYAFIPHTTTTQDFILII
ncbi:hypothetical protein L9F63_005968 [Diploptera punctata]|uniref:Uncharacterized protein n=1 Tax=Diploptera punctata TaxID=6984 RepID=A0AAD8E5N5_DIPPU|nr:hypothetical protein L9F63_005968 [Diploptera punctata]